jgi:purine-binding chemotaxis protein CheW
MDSQETKRLLLFSIGGGLYAANVGYIREIVADQQKMPLPNAPDYIPGVITLRNEVVKIIDIRKIIPLGSESEKKRIIVFLPKSESSSRFGMVVDEVHGIMEVPEAVISHLETQNAHIQNNFMLGSFTTDLAAFHVQSGRKHIPGEDQVIWIDFEDLVETIVDDQRSKDIVFRLTALFNPEYLFSSTWQAGQQKK